MGEMVAALIFARDHLRLHGLMLVPLFFALLDVRRVP